MGKKNKVIRVVLDTNVLVSALLFRGELSKIHSLWKKGIIVPLITTSTFKELQNVLAYPKFALTVREIKAILEEEILPYFDIVEPAEETTGITRDPDDDKFLSCAVSGKAECIVSGDRDLLDLNKYRSIIIISPSKFIQGFNI